jgi:Leishmanolysin
MEEHTMATLETYQARADSDIALSLAGTTSPFTIEVRFLGGLTQPQMDAFKGAADRWSRMIVGDLPDLLVDSQLIDDVLILARGADIDGPGRILGQAGATHVRPRTAGDNAFLPARGRMTFDTADLEQMEQEGTLDDVITHEMGHVIGVSGFIWGLKGLLNGAGTENPTFEGRSAMEEYGRLRRDGSEPTPVPVENEGGPGTAGSHWREKVFRNELMSGFIAAAGNPISRVTVGSLGDMGYVVDMDAAEPYELPNLLRMAEEGLLVSHEAPIDVGIMLPTIPEVVPEDSLQ